MSIATKNLIRLHFAKSIAEVFLFGDSERDDNEIVKTYAKDMYDLCDEAIKLVCWKGIKLNLNKIDKQIQEFAAKAYGNRYVNHVSAIQLISLAIGTLEEAKSGYGKSEKAQMIGYCIDAATRIYEHFDAEYQAADEDVSMVQNINLLENII